MKLHTTTRSIVSLGIFAFGFSQVAPCAMAADNKELAREVKESAMANDFSKFLKPFRKVRGRREHAIKWWPSAKAKPTACTGNGDAEWIHENRVISQEIKGTWLGAPFQATVIFGYDNTLGRYTCTWLDTLTNRMLFFTGKPQKNSKTITLTAQTGDALSREPVELRCVMHLPDRNGVLKTEFYRSDTGGTEYKFMEVVSRRRIIRAG
jgi:Protein of unknown function (DUF1579)